MENDEQTVGTVIGETYAPVGSVIIPINLETRSTERFLPTSKSLPTAKTARRRVFPTRWSEASPASSVSDFPHLPARNGEDADEHRRARSPPDAHLSGPAEDGRDALQGQHREGG